ncbi:MAG: ABC transporter ATP-binding protein [Oscillospiraceae bacterium]|nr:ABC transporter ATP-binding protein [Oscillospiraceae bacterium]
MAETSFLEVKNLVVEYTSDKQVIHAVNNASFSLKRGETLGLVGETGAGKTTIAKTILRILPDKAAKIKAGEIFFEGEDLLSISEEKMRTIRGNESAMIFQDPMTALNPTMKVGVQISEAILLHNNCSKQEGKKRAEEMLEKVGIPGQRFNDYPHQFSGGMKQRVVIAMALACNPVLLLSDEPTTALDVTIQAQVLDMMKDLKTEMETSMIMITHDLGIVAEVCDTVAVCYAGEIVEYGSVVEIFDQPMHPYTIGLFGSLPDMNGGRARLTPIKGMMPDPTNLPKGCFFQDRCPYASDECRKKHPDLNNAGGTHTVRCIRKGDEQNA